MLNVKLRLLFTDRIGIVADIAAWLAENGLNIISMEVERRDADVAVYLEAERGAQTPGPEEIFEMLGNIPNLREIRFIATLPHEERENRSRVALDNISEGVFAIDREGKITTINTVASVMLNCVPAAVVGHDVKRLNLPDDAILECLQGKTFDNVKQDFITAKGRFQCFASGRPISDSSRQIVGAVEIMKDMKDIKILARSLSQPAQITFSDFIGKHPAIREAITFGQKIARTDSIVSLRGESGTGKELFARAIHAASSRPGPFVPLNCAALPEPLLESELFGYVGGAFTGSKKEGKPGLFEFAKDGTIFLDEIADIPLAAQAKMLRVIQEKTVRRVGGTKEIPINPRMITAANKNLEQMVKDKLFREDLYYRINVLPLHLPPLRERTEDIPSLVEHFLFQLAAKLNQPVKALTPAALQKLCRYAWPGNIRELKNVIERAAILCDQDQIDEKSILFSFELGKTRREMQSPVSPERSGPHSLSALRDDYEKQLILETLETAASLRKAAKALGVSHTTLLNKLKKYKIAVDAK